MAGNQPDFRVYLSDKEVPPGREKRRYTNIGAAWWNRSGNGLMLKINPGTVIDSTLLKDYSLGMFKNDEKETYPNNTGGQDPSYPQGGPDDDIPF